MSKIPERNRKLAIDRFRGQCARCGLPGTDVHHRQRRREAGHAVWNLVWLCRTCHSWAHANPTAAKSVGLIIAPWSDTTEFDLIPIYTYSGWVTFDNEGNYERWKFE